MSEFKVGDRVRCINNNDDACGYLELGKVYKVASVLPTGSNPLGRVIPNVKLVGVLHDWCVARFEKVDASAKDLPSKEDMAAWDLFAAAALQGLLVGGWRTDPLDDLCLAAADCADQMLAKREKLKKGGVK